VLDEQIAPTLALAQEGADFLDRPRVHLTALGRTPRPPARARARGAFAVVRTGWAVSHDHERPLRGHRDQGNPEIQIWRLILSINLIICYGKAFGRSGRVIDKLEYLLALARERHFGRAAEACGVSQPTLSVGIKQLEASLGVLLVQRGSRFMGLTPEGERTIDWARRIVGDSHAMRQEIAALRHGLTGRLRIAAVPTALAMVAALTTPFRARHPDVQFTVLSRTSIEILALLENFQIDAGLTYLDNEPLGRVNTVPLYRESYRLLTAADAPLGDQKVVTWAQVTKVPLCLLTPDMQNRRIIEGLLRSAGGTPEATLESNSMIVLFAHVRTGRWASIMPAKLAETLGLTDTIRGIPIIEPEATHTIGLVLPMREPMTPLTAALASEARRTAVTLGA
jgi:DNA-binding transcriptional LysR family regulator